MAATKARVNQKSTILAAMMHNMIKNNATMIAKAESLENPNQFDKNDFINYLHLIYRYISKLMRVSNARRSKFRKLG